MSELINGRATEKILFNIRECAYGACLSECPYDSSDECVEELLKDALALIERLESERDAAMAKVPKWTSVKDGLPKPFVSVQVYMPGEAPLPTVREGFLTDKGVWHAGLYDREPGEVTHWTEMERPPEVQG